MAYPNAEKVDGTEVTIYRRTVNRKTKGGQRRTVTYQAYSARFTDVDGVRRVVGLGTRNKQAAKRKAYEIQQRLDAGRAQDRIERITIDDLADQYSEHCENKGLAPKSQAKYRSELEKIRQFCKSIMLVYADRAVERDLYRFKAWLESKRHKQRAPYSPKSIYSAMVLWKQLFKWAWRQKMTPTYEFAGAELPKAKARPQPCPTTEEVEAIIGRLDSPYTEAVAVLAYSGMRVGELLALRWEDVLLDKGELGFFRIRRGGSNGTTKDKEERSVPIHPRIRPVVEGLPRSGDWMLPPMRDRMILARIKTAARAVGADSRLKTHSMRHHFASMIANSGVPYRMAMAWMGHSSSSILDLYYHLHDGESEKVMQALVTC
ncbi:MAG: site-specific integrase [Phycisphaeraceae bacterium]|nr:site-specific integrase [Phycisphaeraceae bacterium]